ncbi:MAG: phytase [Burkholderiaceae bacterium]|jgi:3-phytase|nr:phytase [Aquabacterium sp.]NUP86951.1 phytase [Burkholderiaceae bacterium]
MRSISALALACGLAAAPLVPSNAVAAGAAPGVTHAVGGAAPGLLPTALQSRWTAQQIERLPLGGWLVLERRGLRLLDAGGFERARLPLRAKHLDVRVFDSGPRAMVLDADTQRTMEIDIDEPRGALAARVAVESPGFSVQAMCMYRDPQGHAHVFLVGDQGLSEQWLLHAGSARLVRRLALPPQSQACRVDDASGSLLVSEEDHGLSAYRASAEGAPRREAVVSGGGVRAFAALPHGAAVVDGRGRLQLWQRTAMGWRKRATAGGPAVRTDALTVVTGPGGMHLAWADDSRRGWHARTVLWPAALPQPAVPMVEPAAQTVPVDRHGDAADDPAIWVHPTDASRSRVLGTNKKQGLLVYDMSGRLLQTLEAGRLNNVDLRQRVRMGDAMVDLAVATQRDEGSLAFFEIDAEGEVRERVRVPTGLPDIYGVCLYQPAAGGLQVLVNDKDGTVQRWQVEGTPAALGARRIQEFRLGSQPEACVADDRAARLYIGEEKRGVWVMSLDDPAERPALTLAVPVGGLLEPDVEGLALYHGGSGSVLVVSSQGNDRYLVARAAPPYSVLGAFAIGINAAAGIDGASETDGLEATAQPLGARYPEGALVVQDGYKRLPDGAQNFKIVDWRDVRRALGLQR